MALEATTDLPSVEHFTLLPVHQQETPSSFFGTRAVLHLRCANAQIKISSEDFSSQPALAALSVDTDERAGDNPDVLISGIDVWVVSSYLTLVSSTKASSVRIPYQTITIHAQEGPAVLLGLNLSDANTPDEDLVFIQLRIIPSDVEAFGDVTENGESEHVNGDSASTFPSSQALFKAIADCQELNPDPPEEGDEDYDETATGATGWITSENMQDFLDENGEFRVPEGTMVLGEDEEHQPSSEPNWPLGHGAGRTRTAEEAGAADDPESETKWQKTD